MQGSKIVIIYKSTGGRRRYYPGNLLAKRLLEFIAPTGIYKSFTHKQIELGLKLGMDIVVRIEGKKNESS